MKVSKFEDAPSADDAAAGLRAHGMYLKGTNFSITRVEVLNPKADGIGSVTDDAAAIDWNAPVEIYTITGMRVTEMTAGGVYVVRQGNLVVKIVK